MTPASTRRTLARTAGAALLASLGAVAFTAAPALAVPCQSVDLSLAATLSPGGSDFRTVTIAVAPDSTLVVGEPLASGALGPDLTSTLHWCQGTTCSAATGELLTPGTSTPVPSGNVTFVFTVALDPASTLQNSAGSVSQQVQLGSPTCEGVTAPPTQPSTGPSTEASGSGATTTGRPSGPLGSTGTDLTPLAWSASAIAVGALLWALARRRQEQR